MSGNSFDFGGHPIPFQAGQSVAAALTDAGVRDLRQTAKGHPRGMFCGMGVCQDCLVTIDGVPNQRACMSLAGNGMTVERQVALPDLERAPLAAEVQEAQVLEPNVAIIGGGAGGLSAAIAARAVGASVVVLDERKVGGGQYYKQPVDHPPLDAQQAEGAGLLAQVKESGAEVIDSVEVWGAFDGPLFLADKAGRALVIRPQAAIIATGAFERPVMVPGWTLPGVMTTGAAQTLWRSYRTLPAQRVLICGSGPLNVQVALELLRGGAEVPMVAEAAPPPWHAPFTALKVAALDPALFHTGVDMLRKLRRRGVPLRYKTHLQSLKRDGTQLRAHFSDAEGNEHEETVDAVCMNAGFEPQNEILRLLGAQMVYDEAFGHLRCVRGANMATSVPNVFAIGDCAGLGGAPAARVEGTIAGRAAATGVGHGGSYSPLKKERRLARHRRFQTHLWKLYDIAPRSIDKAPRDLVVCRCEEITFADILDGLRTQPGHAGSLKRTTRAGMGSCQGRYCGPVVARLVAQATGKTMSDFSYFAPRVPIKPVAISAIVAAENALGDKN